MRKISLARFTLWISTLLVFFIVLPAFAQVSSPVSDLAATHQFGERVSFSGQIAPELDVQSASLTFKLNTTGNSIVIPASIGLDNVISAVYDTGQNDTLQAFSHLTFWFTLKLEDGSLVESDPIDYTYTDNRYDWQALEENSYRIHWIEGDLAFGQAILDMLLNTRQDYAQFLDLPFPEQLDIFVYPDNLMLQDVLNFTNIPWAGGHAVTRDSTILTAIPTGFDQQLDIQRQIPHEITHLRLAEYMGESYDQLPAWLNEGLSSLAEEFTAPSYWQILQAGRDEDSLIPLSQLCQGFPADIQQAGLAYAQSDSFVRYLDDRFGKIGLQALVDAYRMGHACESGVQAALETSLERLEADWFRETFNDRVIPRSISSLLAWVLLLLILLAGPGVLALASSRKRKGKS